MMKYELNQVGLKYLLGIIFLCFFKMAIKAQDLKLSYEHDIQINQLGYLTNYPKKAYLTIPVKGDDFYLEEMIHHKIVWKAKIGTPVDSRFSTKTTRELDFSSFKMPGRYRIKIPGLGYSFIFPIGNEVFDSISKASIKAYYFQRASMALEKKYAGKWTRAMGHPDIEVKIHSSAISPGRPEGFVVNSSRGWYDAGDYNKYVVNSGISMGTLFSAYEDFPEYFSNQKIGIPETGNSVPDLLNEALYNLRWILTMQDPGDGGVYHKCTNAEFDAMIMPDQANKERYLVQKSTAASLDFIAMMAQASRIYAHFSKEFPGLSDSCMNSALKAWTWVKANPKMVYNQEKMNIDFKPPIHTGEYGDGDFEDEWFWAESELWISLKELKKEGPIQEIWNKIQMSKDQTRVPSWSDVGILGYYSLIRFKSFLVQDSEIQFEKEIENKILNKADQLMEGSIHNDFGSIMGQDKSDFVWGSNSVAANQGILLVQAYRIKPNKKYLEKALSNLNYLLGMNATGYCFVTGFGSKSPLHPHHRPSISDGIVEPIPGLLVGGPNPGRQDGQKYEFLETETSYTDQAGAYASNEIAINWNAPLVYLTNALVRYKDL